MHEQVQSTVHTPIPLSLTISAYTKVRSGLAASVSITLSRMYWTPAVCEW